MLPLTRLRKRTRFFGVSGPSFALDFVNGGALDPRITFTRASTATYFDSAGVLQSAAIDVPRLDYDAATLLPRGFLVEEQRTNSIRNNTMQGAVAGTPGTVPTNWNITGFANGITREIVGIGTSNGISYLRVRFHGTATSNTFPQGYPEIIGAVAGSVGQTWTASWFLRFPSTPTGTFTLGIDVGESGGVAKVTTVTPSITSSFQRFSVTRQFTEAGTTSAWTRFVFSILNGATVDITFDIGLPQLELGAFATSVIPTTTTALTRSADVAAVNTLSPWFNATEGTLYAEGILVGGVAGTFPGQVALVGSNVNTDNIRISWTANNGAIRFGVRKANVNEVDFGGPNKLSGDSYKAAGAYKTNDVQAAFDGTASIVDTSATLPVITSLLFGGVTTFQPSGNLWLRRATYYPRRLSGAELASITA